MTSITQTHSQLAANCAREKSMQKHPSLQYLKWHRIQAGCTTTSIVMQWQGARKTLTQKKMFMARMLKMLAGCVKFVHMPGDTFLELGNVKANVPNLFAESLRYLCENISWANYVHPPPRATSCAPSSSGLPYEVSGLEELKQLHWNSPATAELMSP